MDYFELLNSNDLLILFLILEALLHHYQRLINSRKLIESKLVEAEIGEAIKRIRNAEKIDTSIPPDFQERYRQENAQLISRDVTKVGKYAGQDMLSVKNPSKGMNREPKGNLEHSGINIDLNEENPRIVPE